MPALTNRGRASCMGNTPSPAKRLGLQTPHYGVEEAHELPTAMVSTSGPPLPHGRHLTVLSGSSRR